MAGANDYVGYRPAAAGEEVPVVRFEDYDAAAFYEPCIIEGQIPEANFLQWDLDHLNQVAGASSVKVEHRDNEASRFGQGQEETMTVTDLVQHLKQGSQLYYLTTQNMGLDEEGRPTLMASPVTELRGEFPLRPALLPTLVPFNYNLWVGNSRTGSSSGLHHDFHDNIYVLIHGRKQFRLFAPSDADKMYVAGNIIKIHSNGRICYEGELTEADGSDAQANEAHEAQRLAEEELLAAEAAVERGEPGAQERLARAERHLDEVLEQVLDAEDFGDDDDEDGERDSDGDEDEDEDDFDINDVLGSDGGEDKEEGTSRHSNEDDHPLPQTDGPSEAAAAPPKDPTLPKSFSKVDPRLSASALQAQFPRFAEARQLLCTVQPGQILYLPAGWFHEVTSFSDACEADGTSASSTHSPGLHMAFNYWFHPPVPAHPDTSFEKPYVSSIWADDWAHRSDVKA